MQPPDNRSSGPVKLIDSQLLLSLGKSAQESPRCRQHFNLHDELDDPFQRMVVAIEPESYIRPHRHLLAPRSETLVCLRGKIGVLIFDDHGQIDQAISLAPGTDVLGCDIPAGSWHTIVCLQANSVFLEAKPGPYVPFQPEDFATWAPEGGSDLAAKYNEQLRRAFADQPTVNVDNAN